MSGKWFSKLAAVLLLAVLVLAGDTVAQATSIPSSDDTWVREDSADSNRNGDDEMNARTDTDGDRNDVILLRFPTSALGGPVSGSSVNLYWQRTDGSSGKTLSLYGLNETDPDEATWSEATATYNNAPGMIPDGVITGDETTNGNTYDDVRDLDTANLTLLVADQPYVQDLNVLYSFASPALDAFVNADTNDMVSFLIVRGDSADTVSSNQARFWPREQNGGSTAPFLSDGVIPEPTSLVLLGIGALGLAVRRRR